MTGTPSTTSAIGVDIGGTKLAVAAVDDSGALVTPVSTRPTPAAAGPAAIVATLQSMVEEVARAASLPGSVPVGVGSAGVLAPGGRVLSATDAIAGWAGFELRAELEAALGRSVRALNDVHAAALGELRFGAARGVRSFLMATVGTGLGGALVLDGRLRTGRTGTAGSLGHIAASGRPPARCTCGQTGHLEAYVSGPALEAAYRARSGVARSLRDLGALREEDPVAAEVIRDGAETLGRGLADALNLVDVECVVVGGGVAELGAPYLDIVARAMHDGALPGPSSAPLIRARLGTRATLVGAAAHALDPD
ncbi:ROK family protein [Leifsonia sp. NPDC080035]|uniref:ROK family protein n=1 Tax=Leifsonia sp. NPDC080035 TaxID=3143936 RepID=A0AAU7G9L5_9MICO